MFKNTIRRMCRGPFRVAASEPQDDAQPVRRVFRKPVRVAPSATPSNERKALQQAWLDVAAEMRG